MADVSELKKRTEYLIDNKIDHQRVVSLFNECLEDLSDIAKYEKKASFTVNESNKIFPIPSDYIQTIKITVDIGNDEEPLDKKEDITRFGNDIGIKRVYKEMTVNLYYYAELPELDPDSAEPQIPAIASKYHQLLPLYAAIRYMQNWDGETNQLSNYNIEYERRKERLRLDRVRETRHNRQRTVTRTRGWL